MNHAGGMEAMGGNGVGGLGLAAPSDPVELRRLNFQTPGVNLTKPFLLIDDGNKLGCFPSWLFLTRNLPYIGANHKY
jgi:hypothetical protein